MGKQKAKIGNLEKFLLHGMTAADFSTLETKVFGTSNRQKFVFKNPTKAKLEEIEKLAKIMDIEAKELVQRTKAGFEKLNAKELLQIGFEFS